MGSNFWPLANKYATIPDEELKSLPPIWRKLLSKDVETLSSHGGYLWLLFSTERHQAVGRIELMVNKMKKYLKKSGVLNLFKTSYFTRSEMSTFLASVSTNLNTIPLAIYKDEILSPQTLHYHNFTMTPNTDSIIPIIKSTNDSIEQHIQDAILDSKGDKMQEFLTFKSQLGTLTSR